MFFGLLNIRDDNAADDVNENWKENYLLFLSIYIGKGNGKGNEKWESEIFPFLPFLLRLWCEFLLFSSWDLILPSRKICFYIMLRNFHNTSEFRSLWRWMASNVNIRQRQSKVSDHRLLNNIPRFVSYRAQGQAKCLYYEIQLFCDSEWIILSLLRNLKRRIVSHIQEILLYVCSTSLFADEQMLKKSKHLRKKKVRSVGKWRK